MYTVDGTSGELKLYQSSGESSRPLIPLTVPVPGSGTSPSDVPSMRNSRSRLRTSTR